ncbi:MAG: SIS domain-containing protein [Gammaproteobacteria bacterium]|nr:SIS domain-containing protein [Gammaproteobacteria bacterium]MXW44495.1 SIS domain-containing protein [Gammaproteobacteria bacterium]MYD01336.1 SIS domain-containing protein [Gammaproteobacteria bacterium]MYI24656.1 SIS domain-containing protein [Gammaproteobacteria bacterium]
MSIVQEYRRLLEEKLALVFDNQEDTIDKAAEICAASIGKGKLVFTFGTGHGSFAALEMFPRTGTAVGFRPIVESTMISFHRVLGDMGARQYRFIHAQEGYGKAILSSHQTDPDDAMLIFSHSGINAVTMDIAVGAREIGMKVIGVTSVPHSSQVPSRHSSGKRLFEAADVVIDTGAPLGDAGISIDGLEGSVGATSTSVAIAVGQAINAATVEKLVARGAQPMIMVSPNTTEKARANRLNDLNYEELWRRLSSR